MATKPVDLTKCTDEQIRLIDRAQNAVTWASLFRVVVADWKNPYFGAVPYIQALSSIHDGGTDGYYGADPIHSLGIYFLGNATTWKGPVAATVKQIIKKRLGVK